MSYTDVFGGNLIFPSRVSYLALSIAVDAVLQWPTEQQITGGNVVADIIDVNATAVGLTVDMPDARVASTGNKVTFNNVGANSFLVRDVTGGTIQTVQPGEQWVLSLTDNTTDMGAWTTFQLGASVAVASASALAGAGIKAIGLLLNQRIGSDVEAATPFTVVNGDRAKCLIYTAGAGTCNLPNAATVGNDWFFMLRNSGSGTLNVLPPAGLIDGSASLNLDPNGSSFIFTDGVNWFTVGLTVASTIAFDFVSIPVPGSGDFVLSGANLNRISYRFTGALTGNRRIVVPNTTQQYWVDNQTSGAFTLSISTAAQVGPPSVNPGDTVIFYCDATDVINAVNTAAIALPVLISQGGTSATTAPNALLNLGAAASAIEIQTAALSGLSGGGDLTANRPLLLDVNNLTAETVIDTAADFIGIWDADAGAMRKFLIEDVVISDSLIDSAGNVRAFADTGGNLQLRSDANADAVPRRLQFTHQDGTVVGFIGQNSFSEEMLIQNNINNADGTIEISTTHASAEILIGNRLRILSTLQVRGGANNTAGINLTTTAYGNRAFLGYVSSDTLVLENLPNQNFDIQGENSITATVVILRTNPNTGVHLFFNNDGEIARSASLANGGFEVNNTLTGAGFERALTESDLGIETESGSFSVDFGIGGGFSDSNSVTIQYLRYGDLVHLTMPTANFGNSNANSCFTVNTMPVGLRPASTRYGSGPCIDNAASIVLAQVTISSGGVISFFAPNSANPPNYGNFWTTSGVKGVGAGWSMTYRLTDS
ncbi:MAG TPA: hypothetical protein VMW50_00620 [Dehalococcoidia bacterium]|nr:hypothetical protein [Dehalococcoidia bacterium]